MKPSELFSLEQTPLLPGTTLIEASAGTGKTHTIAGLFLRLLLEKKLSVREILVVTFTEAATGELRDRIRRKLGHALAALVAGASDDPRGLSGRTESDRREGIAALEAAIAGFDEAPIYTIHGFCQRMLKDRAFESGALFDLELMQDQSPWLREMAEDYWRLNFYTAHPVLVGFALKNKFGPEQFLPLLTSCLSHPSLRILSGVEGQTVSGLAAELLGTFEQAREAWLADRARLRSQFGEGAAWANKPYNDPEIMDAAFAQLDACFSPDTATPQSLEALSLFCPRALAEGTNKPRKLPGPTSCFFGFCERLLKLDEDYRNVLRLGFLSYARQELPRRKERRKIQSFDDLLIRLHTALAGPGGEALAASIRARYQAALIDEFQDTDPVQYQIFRRIFVGGEVASLASPSETGHAPGKKNQGLTPAAARHYLFLIGDPKQAIYAFRGADIFTYLQAKEDAIHRYTLGENWRSEAGLVAALNGLFREAQKPFIFDGIPFQEVQARGAADSAPLRINGQKVPPLQIWFCKRSGRKPISRDQGGRDLSRAVATEIARLLDCDTRLGLLKLRPEDIAVLVETHRQVRLVQAALTELKIPSVQHTTASVFESREAAEVERILAAVAQPTRESLVRAALCTDILGLDGRALEELTRHEVAGQERLQRFHDYHESWGARGFIPMFQFFLRRERVRLHLLRFPDGERRLTNVLHLAEVLHAAAIEQRLGMEGLVRWLAGQRQSQDPAAEEHQLRLERDENAVKLVTIHKSKGLEYPVVFCPFVWKDAELRRHQREEERVFFHDAQDRHRMVRDLGSPELEQHRQWARKEVLAENVRLLYVALTRAQHRCYLAWGAFSRAGTSAPAYLFHGARSADNLVPESAIGSEACADSANHAPESSALVDSLEASFSRLDDEAMQAGLRGLIERSGDDQGHPTIAMDALPPDAPSKPYQPPEGPSPSLAGRLFRGQIARDWHIASFSGLTSGQREELPDRDGLESASDDEVGQGIFAFPRGAKPGTCLHEIFERLDFTERNPAVIDQLVAEKLRAHGFDGLEFGPAVCGMLQRTLQVPLDPPGLRLENVPMAERLNELEFYFPLKKLAAPQLRDVLARHAPLEMADDFMTKLPRLDFEPVGGFLKGFIDLVVRFEDRFYILDWKSNHLGSRAEDYGPDALRAEMSRHHYVLQYHLYTVALHQYLALRLPGYEYAKHFGGVRYLFVRGIDPIRPLLGVFHDRPPENRVRELSELLIAREEVPG